MYFFDYGNAFLLESKRAGADISDNNGNFKYPSYVQDIMGPMCLIMGLVLLDGYAHQITKRLKNYR